MRASSGKTKRHILSEILKEAKLPASFTKQYFVCLEKHTVIEFAFPDIQAGNSNCFFK